MTKIGDKVIVTLKPEDNAHKNAWDGERIVLKVYDYNEAIDVQSDDGVIGLIWKHEYKLVDD